MVVVGVGVGPEVGGGSCGGSGGHGVMVVPQTVAAVAVATTAETERAVSAKKTTKTK